MRLISIIALSMAVMLALMPVLSIAQQAELAEARAAAEADAMANTSTGIWFLAGCLGGWLGLLVAYIYAPSPPASRLVGKSPEYVAAYTDAYKAAARSVQTKWAWTGCLVSAAAYIAVYALAIVSAVVETD